MIELKVDTHNDIMEKRGWGGLIFWLVDQNNDVQCLESK